MAARRVNRPTEEAVQKASELEAKKAAREGRPVEPDLEMEDPPEQAPKQAKRKPVKKTVKRMVRLRRCVRLYDEEKKRRVSFPAGMVLEIEESFLQDHPAVLESTVPYNGSKGHMEQAAIVQVKKAPARQF